jgi:hypothetical protein
MASHHKDINPTIEQQFDLGTPVMTMVLRVLTNPQTKKTKTKFGIMECS